MITLTSNKQAKKLIHNGILAVDDDIEIAFDWFKVEADIRCRNIYSKGGRRNITAWNITARHIIARNINTENITAWNITARSIIAWNITAWNIKAWNIKARNIEATDINALDIKAWNIKAWNIEAEDINAKDIDYYAVCFAHQNIRCESITGRRENSKHFCLDGEIIIESPENKGQQSC